MLEYNTDTPILLIVFNRPDTTSQVFEKIKKAKPERLYIAADGPRNAGEANLCNTVRNISTTVEWTCQVKTLFQEKNLGCRHAVSKAISWFFEYEEEGIVLEDDCVPADSFFGFCSVMLEKYRDDERIGHITGGNYQNGEKWGDGSYYFSYLTNVWGWAGWRRVWKDYDVDIKTFPLFKEQKIIEKLPSHGPFKQFWLRCFQIHHHQANSWDFQYAYLNLIHHRLSIIPNVNLVTNIGFEEGVSATHPYKDHPCGNIPLQELEEIIHPTFVLPSIAADLNAQMQEWPSVSVSIGNDNDGYYFLKEKLIQLKKSTTSEAADKIPKIIHQVYEDPEGPSQGLLILSQTWKEYHPDWTYRFWNRKAIADFLNECFPDYIPLYRSLPLDVHRWDFIRYLILYQYGGLYVDMDYECLEPLDALLSGASCCIGMEPKRNAIKYNMPFIVGNALMASIPNHNFLKKIIDEIIKTEKAIFQYSSPVASTGPFLITKMYQAYPDQKDIVLLPAELVAPLTKREVYDILSGNETEDIEDKVEKAFAIHYFFGSWDSQVIKD